MWDIQWEAETDLETIYYVGSTSQNLHYPMPPLTCLVLWSCWCFVDFSPLCVFKCLVVWRWCWCWLHWWSVWLWTVRPPSNELSSVRRRSGPIEELSDPMDTAAGLATAADDRNGRREDGYDQGSATGVWNLKPLKSIINFMKCQEHEFF